MSGDHRGGDVPCGRCAGGARHSRAGDDQWKARGLYVYKEAYSEDFLAHFFKDPTGDLYDGGSWQELKETMEKDQGDDARRDNIKELIAACSEPDFAKRRARVNAILDADAYVTFTALEAILAHHDGYNFNHNNYRVYFDPATGRAHFIHHGMDQTFVWSKFSLLRGSASLAWNAVFSDPQSSAKYRERLREISANTLAKTDWAKRVQQVGAKTQTALERTGAPLAAEFPAKIALAQKRVTERLAFVAAQVENLPKPVTFNAHNTFALDAEWHPMKWSGTNFTIDRVSLESVERLHFRASAKAKGAWQKEVLLPAGRYRLEGSASGSGVSFRARAKMLGQQALEGEGKWRTGSCQFETPAAEVTLYVEFNAERGGEAWIDRESLRLVRLN